MEKSIETIWKEGFLENETLPAPKINDLYNQKSIHLIDKLKRMFKTNEIAIIIGASTLLILCVFIGIPIMGIGFALTMGVILLVNKKLSKGLDKIEKTGSSYDYLTAFNSWLSKQISVNRKMATFCYPVFFISAVVGFWFFDFDGEFLGQLLVNELLEISPDLSLFYGVPVMLIIALTILMLIISFFGGKIYDWDLGLVYGEDLRKLDEIIRDMEELRR